MSVVSEIITGCLDVEVAEALCMISDSFETHGVARDMAANGLLTTMIGHSAHTPDQVKDVCSQVQKLKQQEVIELVAGIMRRCRDQIQPQGTAVNEPA